MNLTEPTETRATRPLVTYCLQRGRGGPVKIGMTSNLSQRVTAIASACGEVLGILAVIPGNHERRLHRRLAQFRRHGEWFEPVPEVLAAISERCSTIRGASKPSLLAQHPSVMMAHERMESARRMPLQADREYLEAVLAAAKDLGFSRDQALADLGYNKRTGIRLIKAHGLTRSKNTDETSRNGVRFPATRAGR